MDVRIYASYALTLVIGTLLSYYFLTPLGAIIYLLLWFDIMVITKLQFLEIAGFDTMTLAGILSGIALGPLYGFLFSVLGMSLILTLLRMARDVTILSEWAFLFALPNFDFVSIGISAAIAGALRGYAPFLIIVAVAALSKQIIISMIGTIKGDALTPIKDVFNFAFSIALAFLVHESGLLTLVT